MDTKKILKAAMFTPGMKGGWGLPLLFEGPPGIGKSGIIEETCTLFGLRSEVIIASIREPSDFGGLPIPDKVGKQTIVDYAPAHWAVDMTEDGRGLVFLDELSTCPPAVQKALLRMVLDRTLGDFAFGNGIRFMAAQNAVVDAAGGWDLAPPLANRFGHMPWEMPDADEWTEWLLGLGGDDGEIMDAATEERRVMEAWPKAFAIAKGKVSAFIKANRSLLYQMPEKGDPQRSKAWPSHRSWEMAVRALAGAPIHGLTEMDTDDFVTAFIGTGAYAQFREYAAKLDLPDPEKLLDGGETFTHDPLRVDRTVAVLESCAAFITSPSSKKSNKLKARGASMWELLAQVGDVTGDGSEGGNGPMDLLVPSARMMVRAKGSGFLSMKESRPVLRALQPLLAAAGVVAS